MKLPDEAHTSRPWRIHEIAPDFRLEDVWDLPGRGEPGEFPRLVDLILSMDPSQSGSFPTRALFALRWKLGELFGWDEEESGLGARVATLRDRLPADLREAPAPEFGALPFTSLYLLDDEFAAEVANGTMHGVIHIGAVPDASGGFRAQMAVLVKTNGLFGDAYMAAIKPFRHLIVYPALMREAAREWQAGRGAPGSRPAVQEMELPPDARAVTTLARVDYADAFAVDVRGARERSGEEWARAFLEDAPVATRVALRRAWSALGVQLGPSADSSRVLGWEVLRATPEYALLGARSRLGMRAELLFKPSGGTLLFATLIQHDGRVARTVWAAIAASHRAGPGAAPARRRPLGQGAGG